MKFKEWLKSKKMPTLYRNLKKSISNILDESELDAVEEQIDAGYSSKKISKSQSDKLLTMLSKREKELENGDESSSNNDYSDDGEYSD
tara:strand:- start:9084 stop:9347 length:264 start_codon:yes stop_codon:yes gene_type:complete